MDLAVTMADTMRGLGGLSLRTIRSFCREAKWVKS
jgi:hypothetical protein